MKKISRQLDMSSILGSFWIGVTITIISMFTLNTEITTGIIIIGIAVGGGFGLLIGFIVELICLLIPISMAKTSLYFLVNNMIALVVAVCGLFLARTYLIAGSGRDMDLGTVVIITVIVIIVANIIDYLRYMMTNQKLKALQKK